MVEDERNEQQPPKDEPAATEGEAPPPGAGEPAGEEAGEALEPEAGEALEPEAGEALEPEAAELEEERQEEQGEVVAEAAEEARRPRGKSSERGERSVKEPKREVIPGEHLEPILPEDQAAREEGEFDYAATAYADTEVEEAPPPEVEEPAAPPSEDALPAPVARTPRELAADARYQATGKRKTSVARVILKPGSGSYSVNGRALEDFFPRATLQKAVRQPLETAGYEQQMDVVAKIHGGGVSAQAGALRHGVARALVEADPNLRGELKRRGFLTRDARAKERKKAGLKKARKRPQFSKR